MKKSKLKSYEIALIIAMLIVVIPLLFIFLMGFTKEDIDYEISANGKELHGKFKFYQNNIYASVTSNGYYLVPEADLSSFRSIGDTYTDGHMALDKNNVYVGDKIVTGMDPNTTKSLGNNYYTDGKTTIFSSYHTQKNSSTPLYKEIWLSIKYSISDEKKPQTYSYKIIKLPSSKTPYYTLLNPPNAIIHPSIYGTITNGESTYFNGTIIPKADPNTLHNIRELDNGHQRLSIDYLADKSNVYYHNTLLPLIANDSLYSIDISHQPTDHCLINPIDNMVYVNGISFNKNYAPYKLISQHSSHINQVLFLSNNGVYFYNLKENKVQRAGDNPFLGRDVKEIAPLVFSDGKETWFVSKKENWSRGRTSRSLISRSTTINKLNTEPGKWEKQSNNADKRGAIWKKGNDFYYFDYSDFRRHAFYKIPKSNTAKQFIQHSNEIRELIKKKELIAVTHTELLEAKTKYNLEEGFISKIPIKWIMLLVGLTATILIAWKGQKKRTP